VSDLGSVGRNVNDGHGADPPVTIMLRPLASPLPIGFFAFAIGSFLFTALELGWIVHTQAPELAVIMVVFVAPLQLIASVLAFWARDNGGATALGLFGMTWGTVGAILLTSPTARSTMLGWFLFCMAAVILAFGTRSGRSSARRACASSSRRACERGQAPTGAWPASPDQAGAESVAIRIWLPDGSRKPASTP
jgi:uncharacterized protein